MSKIDDLIKQYCPNGVEYKELGDILDYEQPTRYIVKSARYDSNADTPVLTAGQTFILGYTFEKDGIYKASKDNPVIIFDDFTTSYHWVDFNFKVKSSAMKMLRPKPDFDGIFKYVLYAMGEIHYSPQDHARQWISQYSKFKIPIPHPRVQEEVVRILDTFSSLEAELEVELEVELEARKKQYEYYRNKLLTFDENTTGGGVNWKTLSEVILSLKTGLNPRKFFKLNTSDANNYYVTIKEIQNNTIIISDKTDKINDVALTLCQNRSKLEVGDILFSGTGTIGETAVIETPPTNWNIKEGVYAIKPNHKYIMSRFLMHLFHSENIRNAIFRKVVGGIVKSIPMNEIGKIIIPVPPLPEQERIVAILDKFDSLVNDISEGLPAELTARRQQYEYYRNKLLTFDEAA